MGGSRKGPALNHPLKVSLEDLYNGKTVKLAVNRKVIVGDVDECRKCDGRGAIMEVRQLGPGMIQQMQRTCGFSWKITHLDGRQILVKTRPGEVIKPEMK